MLGGESGSADLRVKMSFPTSCGEPEKSRPSNKSSTPGEDVASNSSPIRGQQEVYNNLGRWGMGRGGVRTIGQGGWWALAHPLRQGRRSTGGALCLPPSAHTLGRATCHRRPAAQQLRSRTGAL